MSNEDNKVHLTTEQVINLIGHAATQEQLNDVRKELGAEIKNVRDELGTEIKNVRNELGAEIKNVRNELGAEIKNVRNELGAEIKNVRNELGTESKALDERITALDKRITANHIDLLEQFRNFYRMFLGFSLTMLVVVCSVGYWVGMHVTQ